MAQARAIFNKKLSIENWLKPKLLSLHKKVLKDSLKRESINLLKYKHLYSKLLANTNKKISNVDDVNIYNNVFLDQSVNNVLLSFQEFFKKRDLPVTKFFTIEEEVPTDNINEALLLLPLKATRDSQVFVQQNHERQNLINNVANDENESNTEEEVAASLFANEVIETNKKKQWNDVGDSKVRQAHRHADGQIKNINEPFNINGYSLMYPGDSSLGAPIELWINCRCWLTYI